MSQKHVYRFFGGLLRRQEAWLNAMAQRGWRLTQVEKLRYTFMPCPPGAYAYCIEFAGHLSSPNVQAYQAFLEEMGYRVWTKNINLNWSMGKVRWRPYGKGWGKLATSPGQYNKELLIVEKEADGMPFQLHTSHDDQARYFRVLRNLWLTPALLCWGLSLWLACWADSFQGAALIGFAGVGFLLPALSWGKRSKRAKQAASLTDS